MLVTSACFCYRIATSEQEAKEKALHNPCATEYRYTEANWKYTLLHQLKEQKRKRLCLTTNKVNSAFLEQNKPQL